MSQVASGAEIVEGPRLRARSLGTGFSSKFGYPLVGIMILLAVWWFGGWLIASDDDLSAFADFAPGPTFAALVDLVRSGDLTQTIVRAFSGSVLAFSGASLSVFRWVS